MSAKARSRPRACGGVGGGEASASAPAWATTGTRGRSVSSSGLISVNCPSEHDTPRWPELIFTTVKIHFSQADSHHQLHSVVLASTAVTVLYSIHIRTWGLHGSRFCVASRHTLSTSNEPQQWHGEHTHDSNASDRQLQNGRTDRLGSTAVRCFMLHQRGCWRAPWPRLVKAQCIRSYGFLKASLHMVGSYIQMQLLIGRLPSCQLFSIVC